MAQTEPDIDRNQWYELWDGAWAGESTSTVTGTFLINGGGTRGAVFIDRADNSSANQRWQFFRVNSTAWTLRTQEGGKNAYMSTKLSDTEETKGNTSVYMASGEIADASAYWDIKPRGDDTWTFTNLANGTGWRMMIKPANGYVAMSDNFTAPQHGQGLNFHKVAAIDDDAFSSIGLVGAVVETSTAATGSSTSSATATTGPTSSTDSSANNTPEAPSGFSTGAKAGIGAGAGIAALIALVVLGLFFWRKRGRKQQYARRPEELPDEMTHYQASPFTKYELNHDDAIKYELPHDNAVSEVPTNQRPAELSGQGVQGGIQMRS